MFKKFVFIFLVGLFNTSAYAAAAAGGAGDAIEWSTADRAVKNVFNAFSGALAGLSRAAFGADSEMTHTLCHLKSQADYVPIERAFEASVADRRQKLGVAIAAATNPAAPALDPAQGLRIMSAFEHISQKYRETAAPLFNAPERQAIVRDFISLLPAANEWQDHLSGLCIAPAGYPDGFIDQWGLPTPVITEAMKEPFIRSINAAYQLNARANAMRRDTAMFLDFLSLKDDVRWTLFAFIAGKNRVLREGAPEEIHGPILDLLGRYSEDRPVADLGPVITAALPLLPMVHQTPTIFALCHKPELASGHEPARPLNPAELAAEIARQQVLVREEEERARAAAAEAARPKPLLVEADHTVLRTIQARLDDIEAHARANGGYAGNEHVAAERIMSYGRASQVLHPTLTPRLVNQLNLREIPTVFQPINEAAHVQLRTWIQGLNLGELGLAAEQAQLIGSLQYIFTQATHAAHPGQGDINFFNSLVTLHKVYTKYNLTDRDNILGLVGVVLRGFLLEHAGRCDTGARGRAFLTDYNILTYLRDHQPNGVLAPLAGAGGR